MNVCLISSLILFIASETTFAAPGVEKPVGESTEATLRISYSGEEQAPIKSINLQWTDDRVFVVGTEVLDGFDLLFEFSKEDSKFTWRPDGEGPASVAKKTESLARTYASYHQDFNHSTENIVMQKNVEFIKVLFHGLKVISAFMHMSKAEALTIHLVNDLFADYFVVVKAMVTSMQDEGASRQKMLTTQSSDKITPIFPVLLNEDYRSGYSVAHHSTRTENGEEVDNRAKHPLAHLIKGAYEHAYALGSGYYLTLDETDQRLGWSKHNERTCLAANEFRAFEAKDDGTRHDVELLREMLIANFAFVALLETQNGDAPFRKSLRAYLDEFGERFRKSLGGKPYEEMVRATDDDGNYYKAAPEGYSRFVRKSTGSSLSSAASSLFGLGSSKPTVEQ